LSRAAQVALGQNPVAFLDALSAVRQITPFPLKDYRLYSSSSLAFFASWRFLK